MAYRIKLSDTPEQALRRVGRDQIKRATLALSAPGSAGSAIHETRKCLKRIRALLRLVRPGLDDGVFQHENARYRDLGRLLSPARDAEILSETLVKLQPSATDAEAHDIAILKQHILEQGRQIESTGGDATIEAALDQLASAKSAMAKLVINGVDFTPVEKGLRDSYRRGVNTYERAYRAGTDEAFHDWRKCVQLHWRHMALMSRAWPDMFSARIEAARQLSQILGDAQDLSVLMKLVQDRTPEDTAIAALNKDSAGRLENLARQRQHYLRELANPRGAILFSLSPKALTKSIVDAWQAAKVMVQFTGDSPPAEPNPATGALAANEPASGPDPLNDRAAMLAPSARRKRSRAPI